MKRATTFLRRHSSFISRVNENQWESMTGMRVEAFSHLMLRCMALEIRAVLIPKCFHPEEIVCFLKLQMNLSSNTGWQIVQLGVRFFKPKHKQHCLVPSTPTVGLQSLSQEVLRIWLSFLCLIELAF